MLVTIYTDASYSPEEGKSAGAAWIRSDKGVLKLLDNYIASSSTHAEIIIAHRAIVKAHKEWSNVSVVLVNTDSLNMCHMTWPFHRARPKSKDIKKEVTAMTNFCRKRNIKMRFKHIKAHQKEDSGVGAFLNNWCDNQANITRIKNEENK